MAANNILKIMDSGVNWSNVVQIGGVNTNEYEHLKMQRHLLIILEICRHRHSHYRHLIVIV
jgi:hypothetical protein